MWLYTGTTLHIGDFPLRRSLISPHLCSGCLRHRPPFLLFSYVMSSNCDTREQPPHPPMSPSPDMSVVHLSPSSPTFAMSPTTGSSQATIPIYRPYSTNTNPWSPHGYGFGSPQTNGMQVGGYPVVNQPGGFVLITYLTNAHKLTNFFKNLVTEQGAGGYNMNPVATGLNAGGQYIPTQPSGTAPLP